MIIKSDVRPKVFFMHVPKTAGTSLRLYLRNQFRVEECGPENVAEFVKGGQLCSQNLRLLQGHFPWDFRRVLGERSKTIVFLREPVSRTISALRHMARDPAFHVRHGEVRGLSVTQMLRLPWVRAEVSNVQTSVLSSNIQMEEAIVAARRSVAENFNVFALQSCSDISLAKERLDVVDVLGTTESYRESVSMLARSCQFHPMRAESYLNVAPPVDDAVSSEDLEIVADLNSLDIELYSLAAQILCRRRASAGWSAGIQHLVEAGIYERVKDRFQLRLCGPMPGSGWHEVETGSSGQKYRWAGRFATLELPVMTGARFAIRCLVFGVRSPDDISIRCNGRAVTVSWQVGPPANAFLGEFRAESGGTDRLEFEFEVARDRLRSVEGDLRELAFILSEFSGLRVS